MQNSGRSLIFGEVLIDKFDRGVERRGGAPFNVAWHLEGFNQNPTFVSRIGKDKDGDQLLRDMKFWGMNTAGIQIDRELPTGYVSVMNQDTDPSYEIHTNVAYDFINTSELHPEIFRQNYQLIYHGSLALRQQVSKNSFDEILKRNRENPVFFDVNLRPPWWNIELIKYYLESSTYLKCNEEELKILFGHLYVKKKDSIDAAEQMLQDFGLKMVIVTRGADGAFLCQKDSPVIHSAKPETKIFHNSVGAGDGFSSVMILGIIHRWPGEISLQRANDFAAAICGLDGAVPDRKEFYTKLKNEWK